MDGGWHTGDRGNRRKPFIAVEMLLRCECRRIRGKVGGLAGGWEEEASPPPPAERSRLRRPCPSGARDRSQHLRHISDTGESMTERGGIVNGKTSGGSFVMTVRGPLPETARKARRAREPLLAIQSARAAARCWRTQDNAVDVRVVQWQLVRVHGCPCDFVTFRFERSRSGSSRCHRVRAEVDSEVFDSDCHLPLRASGRRSRGAASGLRPRGGTVQR